MANTATVHTDIVYSKEEATNYCRIILLMVDIGTETLQNFFYSFVPKRTVKNYFASKKLEIKEGKRKKVFDKSQYAKLTCRDPNPDEFDISLLIKLLNYFKLSSVKLDNLQTIRNEIVGHKSRAELIKQDFESLWNQVENILLNIARCVSEDEEQNTKVKITELKEKVLDVSDREMKIIKIFETTCQEEIAVLREKSDHIQEQILVLHEKSDHNQKEITALHENVQSLNVKVSESQHPANRQDTLNELQGDLIIYYRKVLSKLQLSPLIEEEGCAADHFDIYVKPHITRPSHQGPEGQSKSTPVTFHNIFSFKQSQNIYISSQAGCGKTSFSKYLALTWCQAYRPVESHNQWILGEDIKEMKTFIFLFIVFLRDEHKRQCDVDIMIQNQLLPNLANSAKYTELGLKFLQNLLSDVKCIIVLDGLDEWSHPAEHMCEFKNKHIPHSRARQFCTTLTTSRPWKLDMVGLKPEDIDQKLKLKGLKGNLSECLIEKVVTKLNVLHGKKMRAHDFEQKLRDMKLIALSKIPVVLMQLLTVWFDKEPLGESQREIYSNMIEFLLKRFYKKRAIVSEIENMEDNECSRDTQTPMCLRNNVYCKVHLKILSKLATLAYNTLFTDNEESSLVFDRKIAKKYLETDEEIEMSLAVGILTQKKVLGKMSKRQSHISFIHKTFQEYLAALYVALSPGMATNVEEKIKHVCCSTEKILEMSEMFMFLSGLCPEVMVNLHEHLKKTVSEDSGTQRYRDSGKLQPWSNEGKTLKRVQYTMMECLGECWLNGHKHVTCLPISDFFIESSSPWCDKLKSLIVRNPVCSLYLSGVDYISADIEDILNSVTVFNSIHKLSLWMVETFVVQLVSKHKHSMNLKPENWRDLRYVTLMAMTMSGDILCSLVDSVLQLPKSVQVRLEDCHIEQGTRDWKEYILTHPRLTDSEIVCNLLQFRTSKV